MSYITTNTNMPTREFLNSRLVELKQIDWTKRHILLKYKEDTIFLINAYKFIIKWGKMFFYEEITNMSAKCISRKPFTKKEYDAMEKVIKEDCSTD